MPRILIDPGAVQDRAITVTDPATVHHLLDVLRVAEGERVECVDGAGRWYAARVAHRSKRQLRLAIVDQGEEPPSALAVRLMPALIKPERFDWLVQKAAELGADRISPIVTARGLVRLPSDRVAVRVSRWRRIAAEAVQQCGRATAPAIDSPVTFQEAVSLLGSGLRATAASPPERSSPEPRAPSLLLLPTLAAATVPLREALSRRPDMSSAAVLIGPEGDFTAEEVALAQRYGAVPVSLGRRTLRSETAAVAVLAVLQHAAGEL